MILHTGASCALPEDGHLVGIPPELGDVLPDPPERHHLVLEAIVARHHLVPSAQEPWSQQLILTNSKVTVVPFK